MYPTVKELLKYIALYMDEPNYLSEKFLNSPLPENVAKEFGIMEIDKCGLNKYSEEYEQTRFV